MASGNREVTGVGMRKRCEVRLLTVMVWRGRWSHGGSHRGWRESVGIRWRVSDGEQQSLAVKLDGEAVGAQRGEARRGNERGGVKWD
jgi:hypothetical protein